jgi:hypothetical protein
MNKQSVGSKPLTQPSSCSTSCQQHGQETQHSHSTLHVAITSLTPASFQVQLQHLPNFPCPLLGICISVWFLGGGSYDAQPAWRATAWEQPPWEQPPWELHADTAAGEEEGAKAKAAPEESRHFGAHGAMKGVAAREVGWTRFLRSLPCACTSDEFKKILEETFPFGRTLWTLQLNSIFRHDRPKWHTDPPRGRTHSPRFCRLHYGDLKV